MPVTPFSFSLSLSLIDSRPGLTVAGDIDVSTAPEFGDAIDTLIDITDRDVVIDMASVTYIDSMGLHVLLRALERLQTENRRVGLREPSPVALRLLELCGVAACFDILGRTATADRQTRATADSRPDAAYQATLGESISAAATRVAGSRRPPALG